MSMPTTQELDGAAGHYRTAGSVVVGMGALAVVLFALAWATEADLGFIDQNGIAMIAIAFFVVGGSMRGAGSEAT